MSGVNEIRSTFLDYFAKNGHEIVASSPLVPLNDPTLMFVNAGMVQFKNVFTGAESLGFDRAVTAQKCVRAGGKHNDLDNVGYTARHHTFFEMLGNFSFGDYFKEEAIKFAWELLTDVYGLDPRRLIATVYHEDDVAYDLWRKVAGLPEDRILRIATADNFWAMGETGPCGPCSEIFYDHGEQLPGGPPGSPDEDGDRFVEIWNLVFMQYEQQTPKTRIDLPKPSIDTGMGLERMAAVLQGTHDNYQIDTFRALIGASVEETGVAAEGEHRVSHRVIADHLRAASFLIADGVLPSNEGRGYVLRRIMRRAMRHAHMLGAKDLLLYKLVPTLVTEMGHAYPELGRAEALVTETLKLEENRFRETLTRGLKLLGEAVGKLKSGAALPGDVAFKLYDTYGFPIDLTEDAMRAEGRGVDRAGFDAAMDRQKEEARAAWKGSGDAATEAVWFEIREEVGAGEFLGYTAEAAEGQVTALVVDGKRVKKAGKGTEIALVANQTPFYGESGGQAGDSGMIAGEGGARILVSDTLKKLGALHVHMGRVEKGGIAVGDMIELAVDGDRRTSLRANHSVTHLLHRALRDRLGDHVTQKGSLVAADHLRFDFSQPKAMTPADISAVEAQVNAMIRANDAVTTRLMTPDEAVSEGALALFGEKYGDEVRVVSMGVAEGEGEARYSVELCGGTHVQRTGDIGLFLITSESAVAAGVRRIEALSGEAARDYMAAQESRLLETAGLLKSSPSDVAERVKALLAERKALERELKDAKKQLALGGGKTSSGPKAVKVGDVPYLADTLQGISPGDLRSIADDAKAKLGSGVVAFVAVNEGKAALLVGVTDDLTDRISAVDLVRAGAEALGGKGGGGRPGMAQAGGPDGAAAGKALKAIEDRIASI